MLINFLTSTLNMLVIYDVWDILEGANQRSCVLSIMLGASA